MSKRSRALWAGALVAVVLAALSTVAIAAARGVFHHGWRAPNGECTAPALEGSVVDVTVTNVGGPMMAGAMMGGSARIYATPAAVPAGIVSFRVANTGSLVHEFLVLPLAAGSHVGQRPVGTDDRVDEAGSLAEASQTCGAGAGDGIDSGALGWVTVTLTPGHYELVCNLTGHYAAGMYTELVVS